ncbi:MAG: HAD hydrolase-like protein [Candidatus Paceibacterota bacterium]|jgi:phosphoglycolate phosphatase-like HAD superfamily hydrolase|nr:HAD hydrolase-like protein [Candidatus Paceibacterota bacterium]MDD4831109.1 HAD hydrolase-like protein [Candidatus Paceibacterota bacterium]MDD4875204.1 HAD hydrolase-like protein [Candidatus Paceibacterota bacterium]
MAIKYFITDVDGVIFDRMPVYLSAFAKAMEPFNISDSFIQSHIRAHLGTPVPIQIQEILKKAGILAKDGEIENVLKVFWTICAKNNIVKIFPGVKEALDKAKSQGMFLMASSGSNTDEIRESFELNNLPCDFFLGSDKILKGDEHIDIFADYFSIEKKEFCGQAVFIGDGTTDMQIASRNGILGIGITNSLSAEVLLDAGAKAVISDIREIFEHLA